MNTNTHGDKMNIRITIDLEEYGERFHVTSRSHESIMAAFCDVGQVAEKQRKVIKAINQRSYQYEPLYTINTNTVR